MKIYNKLFKSPREIYTLTDIDDGQDSMLGMTVLRLMTFHIEKEFRYVLQEFRYLSFYNVDNYKTLKTSMISD